MKFKGSQRTKTVLHSFLFIFLIEHVAGLSPSVCNLEMISNHAHNKCFDRTNHFGMLTTSHALRCPKNKLRLPLLRKIRAICRLSRIEEDVADSTDDIYTDASSRKVKVTADEEWKPIVEFQSLNDVREPDIGAGYNLFASAIIGALGGFAVASFKLSIEELREILYMSSFAKNLPIFFVPLLGGIGVSTLAAVFGEFPPGLRGTVKEIDTDSLTISDASQWSPSRFLSKPLAAICTLGTGCSLGPEGPSVELGMTLSRIFMAVTPPSFLFAEGELDTASRIRRNRLLLSVGAAAGLSAGFNAPLSGVFFALEIVQQALPAFTILSPPTMFDQAPLQVNEPRGEIQNGQQEYFSSGSGAIAPLLLASVISALVSQIFLGDSLALRLPPFDLKDPLIELPLYLLLGFMSGVVATLFSVTAQFSKEVFDGDTGPAFVQNTMTSIPVWSKPVIGGLVCGIVGTFFPQILFFGYDTLNALLANESLSSNLIVTLFTVKTFTTAVSAGSGLIGGTFAPSLFLGGMLGAFFHNTVENLLQIVQFNNFELAEAPAYCMVGAASVLAALFRAPLTASLLLFETTRDYGVILPLMASAGIGSLVGDAVERVFEERKNRDKDAVSWGDLADDDGSIQR